SALAAAATLAIAAASAAPAQPSATRVSVRLKEFRVLPARSHAAPGKVTFVVRNVGAISHEFVVLRTNIPVGKLPTSGANAKENGRVGKIGPVGPGQTRRLTLALRVGRYVLLCNLPGHYKAGQFASFRVP